MYVPKGLEVPNLIDVDAVNDYLIFIDKVKKRVKELPDELTAVDAATGERLADWQTITVTMEMKMMIAAIAIREKQSNTVAIERFFSRAVRSFCHRRSVIGALEESLDNMTLL
jgi:hypothetical protein